MDVEMRNNWIKIGLISLTVMMFVSVFSVEAEQSSELDVLVDLGCPNEDIALENLEYARKGVDIWNESNSRDEALLNSVLNLVLGTGFADGCLYVANLEDTVNLRNSLLEAGLNELEMVNGLIGRLNKSGYVSPIPKMKVLEN